MSLYPLVFVPVERLWRLELEVMMVPAGSAPHAVARRSEQPRAGERFASEGRVFVWHMNAPYLLSGAVLVSLVSLAMVIGWRTLTGQR